MRRLATVLGMLSAAGAAYGAEPADARRAQLLEMIRHDCGACHGLTLKGGLGPSLEPATLAGRDTGQLGFVILNGRRGTPMPPWRAHLTETEALWLAETLKRGLPR